MSGTACRCCLPTLPGGRVEGSHGEMGSVPTLRDCLWKLEGAVLGRVRAAMGAAGHARMGARPSMPSS